MTLCAAYLIAAFVGTVAIGLVLKRRREQDSRPVGEEECD